MHWASFTKLGTEIGHDNLMTSIDFEITRSKVKVRMTLNFIIVSNQKLVNALAYIYQTWYGDLSSIVDDPSLF